MKPWMVSFLWCPDSWQFVPALTGRDLFILEEKDE